MHEKYFITFTNDFILNTDFVNSTHSYLLTVDLEYPSYLHD